ncbi:LeuD/DmdB family oxidoreductase small subunit [Candidatus Alkanophaga liquidiphilum]|nr:3-isopropylmalate dehydratase small subunit [Candidatus Alkanophaga liquidiphilum]
MQSARIKGRVFHIFPENTNTDEIISGKYKYDELDLDKLAVHTFESVYPGFYAEIKKFKSPILVAARNFGCGSSREQAPHVLKACGVRCIVATSFARIFFRNAINIGLPLVECDIAGHVKKGDELEIDMEGGEIKNLTSGEEFAFKKLPPFLMEIFAEGGLIPYLKKRGGFG